MSSFDPDHALAIILQARFNEEAKKAKEKAQKENVPLPRISKPLPTVSLVDSEWETTDPCPDVHGLFLAFNERFFWGRLIGIEVKWSAQMTSCAGICVYEGRNGLCSVRLSAPLLKLRPRSDLVETLLHEMIHAYLFVTNNNRDRDGHGPEFHKHMYRINKEAGTNITVYHSFHAEVKLYQQHWWRCDGPCQHKPPFYGMVKRARNRAPGPNDLWWANHQAECGGHYVKVREPEDYKKKKTGAKEKPKPGKDIRNFFNNPAKGKSPASSTVTSDKKPGSNIFGFNNINGTSSSSQAFPKPIASSPVNRVVGFGNLSSNNGTASKSSTMTGKGNVLGKGNNPRNSTGQNFGGGNNNKGTNNPRNSLPGRNFGSGGMLANRGGGTLVVTGPQKKTKSPEKPQSPDTKLRVDKFKVFAGSGQTLGGGGADRSKSRLLSLGEPQNKKQKTENRGKNTKDFAKFEDGPINQEDNEICKCSVCNQNILREEMELHLENCSGLQNVFNNSVVEVEDETEAENINEKGKETACPICNVQITGDINVHVDECLNSSGIFNMIDEPEPVVDNDLVFVQEYKVPKPIYVPEDDVQIVEQEDEARVACFLCGMRFGVSRINDHVNQCLDSD